jgi:hypothetical protein
MKKTESDAHIGATNANAGKDQGDVEANAPLKKKVQKEQTSSSAGKWRALAILLIVASVIIVIVVPPSVIVPRNKSKASSQKNVHTSPITVAEIDAAQKAWGDALVTISDTYSSKGFDAAKAVAQQVLDAAYGYNAGMTVSFKPTLTYGAQTFRFTNEGALSYFVGRNSNYPTDTGFALKNWTEVVSVRTGVLVDAGGRFAMSMGNVFFKNKKNEVTKVDKTWGYYKDNDGVLRIILHHSSLPYVANAAEQGPNVMPPAQAKALDEVDGLLPNTANPIPISLAEIEAAQKAWGDALLQISSTYSSQGLDAAKTVAQQVLDAAYGYKIGVEVLFKPTLTSGNQVFRTTNEGALSYFVGNNTAYPQDKGFAIKKWINVTSVRSSIFMHPYGGVALSMGNVYFGNADGTITKVDKTWGYYKGEDGVLRIILHHSSLPYDPSAGRRVFV